MVIGRLAESEDQIVFATDGEVDKCEFSSVPEVEAEAEAEAAEAATAAPEAKVSTTAIDAEAAVPVVTETKEVSSSNLIKGDIRISPTQAAPRPHKPQHTSARGHSSHYP